MTYKHYNAVAGEILEGIETATERALFLDACYMADFKGILRMSQIELSQVTLWSLATIKRVFSKLEEAGLLLRLAHGRYKINVNLNVGTRDKSIVKEATGLNQELAKWIKKTFAEETVDIILQDKEILISEAMEDETVVAKAIEAGLLVEERREDTWDDEPGTLYRLAF